MTFQDADNLSLLIWMLARHAAEEVSNPCDSTRFDREAARISLRSLLRELDVGTYE